MKISVQSNLSVRNIEQWLDRITMEFHPYADIFPLIQGNDFDLLCKDIEQNGLNDPIVLLGDQILDGRNRYLACTKIGIKPEWKQFTGEDPLAYVLSTNLHRRHLTASQRAALGAELATLKSGVHARWKGDNIVHLSNDESSKKLQVSKTYIKLAKEIKRDTPELFEELKSGETELIQIVKQRKKDERIESILQQSEEIKSLDPHFTNTYNVIVVDPPWPYGTPYDPDGRRAANPYPEMSLEDIGNIQLPATDDCVLWLWTTHRFMRESFDLLDQWGFRDVSIVTWVKNRIGLGTWLRSQTEFCIMAVKGKPIVNLTNESSVLYGDTREHSRKPDEFYQMVNDLCIGSKLDYFSREQRIGWDTYGTEAF